MDISIRGVFTTANIIHLSVNIFSMAEGDDKNRLIFVIYFIDYPVFSNPNSPSISSGELLASERPWIFGKQGYFCNDFILKWFGDC